MDLFLESKNIYQALQGLIPVEKHQLRLLEIDELVNTPGFWTTAQSVVVMKERQKLLDLIEKVKSFRERIEFIEEFYQSGDEYIQNEIQALYREIKPFKFKLILNQPEDINNAILSISAGAGGLEAANWVNILLRMYARWSEAHGFQTEILDLHPSEEHSAICIDSVSIRVVGEYAYGLLRQEMGIHRLIRNSPFNAGDARHTSFAAVDVIAEVDDSIEVKIDEKQLEISAQVRSGNGGQARNRTNSAVRLKYAPADINIIICTERDFHANKRTAMKMLKAKLYDLEVKKRQIEQDKIIASKQNIAFGSQIRSYILSPYQLVKDHRTDFENRNSDAVLDGDLDGFIYSNLEINKI